MQRERQDIITHQSVFWSDSQYRSLVILCYFHSAVLKDHILSGIVFYHFVVSLASLSTVLSAALCFCTYIMKQNKSSQGYMFIENVVGCVRPEGNLEQQEILHGLRGSINPKQWIDEKKTALVLPKPALL